MLSDTCSSHVRTKRTSLRRSWTSSIGLFARIFAIFCQILGIVGKREATFARLGCISGFLLVLLRNVLKTIGAYELDQSAMVATYNYAQ